MPTRVHLRTTDHEYAAEIRGSDVVLDHDSVLVSVADEGDSRFRVTAPDLSERGVVAASGTTIWVSVAGFVFEFDASVARKGAGAGGQETVSPPMAATVVRIAVGVGQHVQRGDLLIALEAMKMELPIRAPRDGVVGALHCQEGDLVQPDQTLVELT